MLVSPKSVHWFSFQIWNFSEHKTFQQNIISEFGANVVSEITEWLQHASEIEGTKPCSVRDHRAGQKHIGAFLTEFSRKAIISQYCYSSLAAVNQDNHLNIILGTYDPFRILQHLFFIQSDVLEIRTEKSF